MITRTLDVATSPSATPTGMAQTAVAQAENGLVDAASHHRSAAPHWQRLLAGAVGSVAELLDLLGLSAEQVGASEAAARDFPLRVPRGFAGRMQLGDPRDPLLLQVLASKRELERPAGWVEHPLEESSFSPAPGLLHKYHGRTLLIATGACAVHCRYCFRRHFPYGEHATDWQEALDYLAADPSIEEVILSGGDPLSLRDEKLGVLARQLDAVPHLQRLRLHTRLPVVLPERVDDSLLGWLAAGRLSKVVVLHVNHPREIDSATTDALKRLRSTGALLLNQSVLLRGVNDEAAILRDLSVSLFNAGVMPYYLHVMDRVAGAAHFEVALPVAEDLVEQLRASSPGYLVPKLVREDPGRSSKTPLSA